MQRFFSRLFLFLLPGALPILMNAQSYSLQLHSVDNHEEQLLLALKPERKWNDASAILGFVRNIPVLLQEQGFLAASVDSVTISENDYQVFVFVGQQYKWAKLSFDSLPPGLLLQVAVQRNFEENRPLAPKKIALLTDRILQWSENHGYPFAQVWLDEIRLDTTQGLHANICWNSGPLISLDTVRIHGKAKINRSFLLNYLGLKEGELYNEQSILTISKKLSELSFLQEARTWSIIFKLSETAIDLYLEEKKANQVNALIGLLPNNVETGKFLLTVDALFAFQNILSFGESISVSYQNLQYKSPRIKADVVWPYLFNTPIGLDAHFDLFKKDTSFRRTSFQAGLRYHINASDYARIFYQNQSNRLITADTNYVRTHKTLPDNMDVSANGGGIELYSNHTDYLLNPRKGFEYRISASALHRKVQKNDAITGIKDGSGFDYKSLFDSLAAGNYQYFIQGEFSYYFSLLKNLVFRPSYKGAIVEGRNLFRNELYQIGGFKMLRGFDEQSIYASQYHLLSLELRLLFSKNAYFYLFSDNAYVETSFNKFYKKDIYTGFGLGTSLETKTGIFAICYGLGRSENYPLQFRQSKIHFGYAAYF